MNKLFAHKWGVDAAKIYGLAIRAISIPAPKETEVNKFAASTNLMGGNRTFRDILGFFRAIQLYKGKGGKRTLISKSRPEGLHIHFRLP